MRAFRAILFLLALVSVTMLPGRTVRAGTATGGTAVVSTAIVFGGGGLVGGAWEAGVVKALNDRGITLNDADLFVGTSAGAMLATELRSGQDINQLYQTALNPPPGVAQLITPASPADVQYLLQTTALWAGPDAGQPGAIVDVGARAVAANALAEDTWTQVISIAMNVSAWPAGGLGITAVDTSDGSTRIFTSADGATIQRAVAASTAVPALVQPITIGDRRYMDGGVTGTHIDAALGDNVVAILPYNAGAETDQEVARLRSSGGQALLVEPSTPLGGPFDLNAVSGAGAAGLSDGAAFAGQIGAVLGQTAQGQ